MIFTILTYKIALVFPGRGARTMPKMSSLKRTTHKILL